MAPTDSHDMAGDAPLFEGPPCHCGECRAAGVTDLSTRLVPVSGGRPRIIHGAELRSWHQERDRFLALRESFVRSGTGMRRLKEREPGEEG